jgi:glucose uptake protein GlcU
VLLLSVGGGTELGLAVALILRGVNIILSFMGGLLFLFEKILPDEGLAS